MKKILALVLALLVALSMTAALAADDIPASGVKEMDTASTSAITINIQKEIVFYNAESSSVYEPAVTYTYALTPATETAINNAQIKDNAGVIAGVKPGVADGAKLNTTSVTFSAETLVTEVTSAGKSVKKPIEISIDPTKFEQPGVYRYVIEETDPSDMKGVVSATETGANVRYLDVYIKREGSAMAVYGYVLFKGNVSDTQDGSTDGPDLDEKTEGFTNDDDSTTDDDDVDTYTTYNLEVKKTISGTMGDTGHQFPFVISLSNSVANANFTVDADKTAVAAAGTIEVNKSLANNDTVKLIGVPQVIGAVLTGTVVEKNDTFDVYTPSIVEGDTTGFNGQTLAVTLSDTTNGFANNTTATVNINLTNAQSDTETELSHITIDNKLDAISPTGVVLRFAPYIAMLAGGVLLLVLARKRRTNKNED